MGKGAFQEPRSHPEPSRASQDSSIRFQDSRTFSREVDYTQPYSYQIYLI